MCNRLTLLLLFLYLPTCATVHIFGDSHAYFCFSNASVPSVFAENSVFCIDQTDSASCRPISIHYMGPVTMHRVGRDGLQALDIRNSVQEGDTVVFVFGEIDVRCHIGKQRDEKERAQQDLIQELVQGYMKTIAENVSTYSSIDIVIMSPVPPMDTPPEKISLPIYGSLQDRVTVNNALCDELKYLCDVKGYYFLDIRPEFANFDGSLNWDLSDGIVHVALAHNHIIKEKLFLLTGK